MISEDYLEYGKNYRVVKVTIDPKELLSLHRHKYRDEYWTIISGEGEISRGTTLDDWSLTSVFTAPMYTQEFVQANHWHKV